MTVATTNTVAEAITAVSNDPARAQAALAALTDDQLGHIRDLATLLSLNAGRLLAERAGVRAYRARQLGEDQPVRFLAPSGDWLHGQVRYVATAREFGGVKVGIEHDGVVYVVPGHDVAAAEASEL